MKNIIILLIGFFLLTSCNLCKELSDSSDEETVELEKNKKEKSVETYDDDEYEDESKVETKADDEIEMLAFDKRELPSEISYNGYIVTGKRWLDKNGENILILTKTKETSRPDEYNEERLISAELYAYHFVSSGGRFNRIWKIYDFIKDCLFDLTLDFIDNSLIITDLDDDGVAESTFLYKLSCRSDVTPSTLKLMMHENANKYALRGNMWIEIQGHREGGDFKVDKAFNSAPNVFLQYAKEQWTEFSQEVFQ